MLAGKRILLLVLTLALAVLCIPSCKSKPMVHSNFEFFDTVTTVTASHVSNDEFEKLKNTVYSTLRTYHGLLDIYHEYEGVTNLCTVNRLASQAPVRVSRELFSFLQESLSLCNMTNGYTNIAMGSVLKLWHEAREMAKNSDLPPSLPDSQILAEAAVHTDASSVILNEENLTVYFTDPKLQLDVGAIGKGFAADRAAEALHKEGFTDFILNLGGNVLASGMRDSHTLWRSGISDPQNSASLLCTLQLDNAALVTSGSNQRYFEVDGVRYHHIIHPNTLIPENHHLSVSVLCESSAVADVLSTALFNMPTEDGLIWVNSLTDVEAIWVLADGSRVMSDHFSNFTIERIT